MKMQKPKNVFEASGEIDWITVNGQHIPVGEEESKEETVKEFIQSHENKPNNEQNSKDEQIDKKEKNGENLPKLDPNKQAEDEEAEELKKVEEEKKKKRQEQLSKDIDAILAGTYKGSHVTLLDNTPQILQDIGLADKPIQITAKHLYTCANEKGKFIGKDINYHGLGSKFMKQVPQLLKNPKVVFRNKRAANEIIAVIDAKDKEGRQVIVPILMNGIGRQNNVSVQVNIVKSIYGRNNFEQYIQENATAATILYPQQKKEKQESEANEQENKGQEQG